MGDLFDPRAFALGMVALVNPCGFAMLPAYLGFFLGLDEDDNGSRVQTLNRAQMVGLSMSLGFLAVFGVLGIAFSGLISEISAQLSWVTIIMGVLLGILGIAMLNGYQPIVSVPHLEKGTGSKSSASMFLFGVSYAIASLSCTIGLFISAVATSATNDTFLARFGAFFSYGLGMGLLATVLTLAVGFGKRGIVTSFRKILPKINLISAVVLVVVGIYLVLYGVWRWQIFDDTPGDPTGWVNSIVTTVEGWQTSLTIWVDDRVVFLGWSFFIINAGLIVAGFISRRTKPATMAV